MAGMLCCASSARASVSFAASDGTRNAEPAELVRIVKDAVEDFAGAAPKADDITALALRWRPAEVTIALASLKAEA